ncbi:reverse transcriptase domain-containing protein [Tanacetum coccineum]
MPHYPWKKEKHEEVKQIQHFALVKHPQSTSLAKRSNRSLDEGINARLGKYDKDWVEELPMSYGLTRP